MFFKAIAIDLKADLNGKILTYKLNISPSVEEKNIG